MNALMIALNKGYTDIAANILQRDNLPKQALTAQDDVGVEMFHIMPKKEVILTLLN